MMRKYLGAGVLVLLLLFAFGAAFADPIPGCPNELDNGDFETGTWGLWEHGAGLALGIDGPTHNWGVFCKEPTQSLLLRQVVDDMRNPLWDPTKDWKMIDLMADIRCVWAPGDPGHPTSRISFRLDWWGTNWNDVEQGQLPPAEYYSNWITYSFTDNAIWRTVNPFANDIWVLRDATGKLIQPRWISVEILIDQAPSEFVWVDNVILTSKCIPEPMSMVLGIMGLGSVAGLRRMFRK